MGDRLVLEIDDAEVVRDGRVILGVQHLVVHEGEHMAVLGPNGAGKSTLIGLLTRDVMPLWRPRPPVRFMGSDLVALADIRRVVGVVSAVWQEAVDVHVPVREIVLGGRFGSLGVPPHLRGTASAADDAATQRALAELGIEHLADRDMRTLSTGEARRALVARAIVNDPAIIVLDEPCAGLDPTAAHHVRALMRELAAGGRTMMLVTHHVEDIVAPVDRVVLMRNGRIVADGAKRDVLTGPGLSELFGVRLELDERQGEYRLW